MSALVHTCVRACVSVLVACVHACLPAQACNASMRWVYVPAYTRAWVYLCACASACVLACEYACVPARARARAWCVFAVPSTWRVWCATKENCHQYVRLGLLFIIYVVLMFALHSSLYDTVSDAQIPNMVGNAIIVYGKIWANVRLF